MRRNWVMKLLTACVAFSVFVFVYLAYHTATFLLSFPDSAMVRWADRFSEVFPTFAVVPRALFGLTGNPLFELGNAVRWPGIVLNLLLAGASGVLAFGLARYRKWARTALGALAATFVLLHLLKLFPLVLHVFFAGLRNSVMGTASDRVGPLYTLLGIMVSAGCAWLMWRWRDEPEREIRAATPGATKVAAVSAAAQSIAAAHRAREQAKRARLRKSILWIRIGEVLTAASLLLGLIPGTPLSVAVLRLYIGVPAIWLLALALIWYLLSQEEPRLGIGMAAAFGVLQFLPYAAISLLPFPLGMMYLLGVQGLGALIVAVLPALGALIMSIGAIRATVVAGRPATQMAGQWGVGVLVVLLGGLVNSTIATESSYAKGPKMSRERESQQSDEYQRGHAAQQDVLAIGKCVFQYAAAHPSEGFPEKLDAVGPGGNGCFPDVNGVPGHVFLYQASSSAGVGARDRFVARSKETEHIGSTFSLPDKMVDESGIVAAIEREKRGFAFSPALVLTKNIGDCLKMEFEASGGETYPANLHGLLSIKGQYGVPCIQSFEAKDLSVIDLWRNKFSYRFYVIVYQPAKAANGEYKGFRIEARPQEYGEQALRSYFMDEGGVVHATPQDRAATANDADANCEYQQRECTVATVSANETPQ